MNLKRQAAPTVLYTCRTKALDRVCEFFISVGVSLMPTGKANRVVTIRRPILTVIELLLGYILGPPFTEKELFPLARDNPMTDPSLVNGD